MSVKSLLTSMPVAHINMWLNTQCLYHSAIPTLVNSTLFVSLCLTLYSHRFGELRQSRYIKSMVCIQNGSGIAGLYSLSYMWYTTLGTLTTVVVGIIVSFMTGR